MKTSSFHQSVTSENEVCPAAFLLQIPSFLVKLWILSLSERTFSSQILCVHMKTVKQACFLIVLELLSFLVWNIPGRLGVGKDDWEVVWRRFLCGLLDTQLGKMLLLVVTFRA